MKLRILYLTLVLALFLGEVKLYANYEKALDFDFSLKAGYLVPNEEVVRDIYDGGLVLGLEGIVWTQSNLGAGLGIDRFGASGDPQSSGVQFMPIHAECEIYIIPITVSALYRLKNQSSIVVPYFGIGTGYYYLNEKLKTTYSDEEKTNNHTDKAIGFHWLAGVQYKVFTLELKYTSAKLDGNERLVGDSADIGGFNILAGLRF